MNTSLVSLVNGIPTTTSQKVAEVFGKKHSNVLRDIERIGTQVPEKFLELNYELTSYTQTTGICTKESKLYLLTRDGLTLLVMGYTGKEAMKFKLAYIEAFNAMEKRLEELRAMPDPCLSVEDRRPLSVLVGQWAGKAHLSFPDCWRELHGVFGITTVSELPAAQLPAALAWVQAKIEALSPSVPNVSPSVPNVSPSVPDFPLELAVCGAQGKEKINLWNELEDLRKKLVWCNSMVFLTCSSGHSMYMTPEKNLFHTILRESVKQAQDSLEMAQHSVQSALRIKGQVDFFSL